MLAVVTERGDVGVMRAMALAIAAAIAAAADSLCDCNRAGLVTNSIIFC